MVTMLSLKHCHNCQYIFSVQYYIQHFIVYLQQHCFNVKESPTESFNIIFTVTIIKLVTN